MIFASILAAATEFTLDGSTCYYASEGSSAALPTGTEPYAIEADIKPASAACSNNGGIVGWGNYGTANSVNAFRLDDGCQRIKNYWWSADLRSSASSALLDGSWHHVTAEFDGTTRKLSIDGVTVATDTTTGGAAASNVNFCVGKTYGNEYFTGSMKGVRIWNNGGVVYAYRNRAAVSIIGSTVTSCSAGAHGGVVYAQNRGAVSIIGSTMTGCSAVGSPGHSRGGVVYALYSISLSIAGVDFIDNRAAYSASVLHLESSPSSISDASFTGNDGVTIRTLNAEIDWDCRLGSCASGLLQRGHSAVEPASVLAAIPLERAQPRGEDHRARNTSPRPAVSQA
ncbi:hypothetical protein EMIHUDRAFT_225882 [Emiliania huxleyi CCMP1516]|uniref:LamG-like jellyroll fold domain-containing protein n=2 Tax=Emiliania huxleyi TaxID=2903 RepID=A0A0D3KN41_EMIH1|nr:hypothetical protein EMIHUDRAFT_225882 [Emiliania huxleyi CCMP1516]EOD37176.1 hypothetical protein EMIHUDRAFT_225882 [Emiliania huxleyi CCMP1516]|eukprot:XP_005789605.1 hypothetical protein EMIHUDRAFT_225882 [Emiliania huxleyi CCMP1516]